VALVFGVSPAGFAQGESKMGSRWTKGAGEVADSWTDDVGAFWMGMGDDLFLRMLSLG